jgi:flagellar assembly factor FliW
MPIVETTRFGSLERVTVADDAIYHFPDGLPGFEHLTEFALIEEQQFWPFTWLQPLAEAQIGFVLMDPALFAADYKPDINPQDVTCLDVVPDDLLDLRSILVVPSEPKAATANLKAPLVLNRRTRSGKQVILMDDHLSMRHPVFGDPARASSELSATCSS